MYCTRCGNEIRRGERVCTCCGGVHPKQRRRDILSRKLSDCAESTTARIMNEWNEVNSEDVRGDVCSRYATTGFVIVMLILCFPLGLYLMWKYKKFGSGKIRIVLAALLVGCSIYMLIEEKNSTTIENQIFMSAKQEDYSMDLSAQIELDVCEYIITECSNTEWDEDIDWMQSQGLNLGLLTKSNYEMQLQQVINTVGALDHTAGLTREGLYINIATDKEGVTHFSYEMY